MKPQALAKLDLLAAAKEAALLDALSRHNATLRRYESQCEVLTAYQQRLGSMWRDGAVVSAGDAKRAGQFSDQAEGAAYQLAQAIRVEQAKLDECASALAELRTRRRTLQERRSNALRLEQTIAQERAAQSLPHPPARPRPKTQTPA